MNLNLIANILGWLTRRLIDVSGAWLVQNGVATDNEVQAVIAGLVILVNWGWSAINHFFPHITAKGVRVPFTQVPRVVAAQATEAVEAKIQ